MHSDCLLWPEDHVKPNGYGFLTVEGKVVYAHRWAIGVTDPEVQVDHLCHNRAAHAGECGGGDTCIHRRCFNPEHLFVTDAQGNLSASPHTLTSRRFRTACSFGHEYTDETTIWEHVTRCTTKGIRTYTVRKCRTCKREYEKRRYHARRGHIVPSVP